MEIGAFEAKTHLSRLLERVRAGERITITKHGVPVAELVPPRTAPTPEIERIIKEIKELRSRTGVADQTIATLVAEGRRF